MKVVCSDATVSRGKLTKDAVYCVVEIKSGADGDFFVLAETGTSTWFTDRFRPFDDNAQFLSGADAASETFDNRRKQGADA